VAAPGHPFLRAVIARVMGNIDRYDPWRHGTGRAGVLWLTGPTAYSLAIEPLRGAHAHRMVDPLHDLGFHYTVTGAGSHRRYFSSHYSQHTFPVVKLVGPRRLKGMAYSWAKRAKRWLSGGAARREVFGK
jgi:hypothetical protein